MTWVSDDAIERLRAVANWPEFPSERYAVTAEIGRGGMGTVYAAVDAALDREVAIKVSNGVGSRDAENRLARESRIVARLEHPGIVPVHDVGRLADGRLFYVMKRVHGRTLTEHLRDRGDLSDRLRIFERICEAVAFAHARQIVHRDLKPDNVMIGSFGEVMVLDWGVAKALDERTPIDGSQRDRDSAIASGDVRTRHGTVLGTHGFMAPEQARGDSVHLDQRADVYSLGAILLTLLAGADAVTQPSAEVRQALSKWIPRPLRSICARAMADDPAERYASAADLRDDVARYRAGQPVGAHRETSIERVTRVVKVYRMPILLVLTYMIMRVVIAWTTGW